MRKTSIVLLFVAAFSFSACASAFIDRDAVENALVNHKKEFNSCYAKGTKSITPRPSGTVRINFTVNQEGKAEQVSVGETSLHAPLVESCLIEVVKDTQFPPSGGENARISYPFRFVAS